jgi:hypothetical protein
MKPADRYIRYNDAPQLFEVGQPCTDLNKIPVM